MFITLEGIDGCGKSTQAKFIYKYFASLGKALLTREPGGWDGGNILRNIALEGVLSHSLSELFLFMIDRLEHLNKVIIPALNSGTVVVCERYHDSTIAYQLYGRGINKNIISDITKLTELPTPDLTILFDIDANSALTRVGKRGKADAFENEGVIFMERVRQGYLDIAAKNPKRFLTVQCSNKNPEEIFNEVCSSEMFKSALMRATPQK